MGNSYVSRHVNVVLEALNTSQFRNQFGKIYFINRKSCPSFDSTLESQGLNSLCSGGKGLMLKFLQQVKPDLLLLLNRLDHVNHFKSMFLSFENDTVTQNLTEDLVKMANVSGKVIVIQPHHTDAYYEFNTANVLSHVLATNQTFPKSNIKREYIEEALAYPWLRMQHAARRCHNCYTMDVLNVYCDPDRCATYDYRNKLAYFCDAYHVTEHGAGKILPSLREKINQVMNQ